MMRLIFEKFLDDQHSAKKSKLSDLFGPESRTTHLSALNKFKLKVSSAFLVVEKYDRASKLTLEQTIGCYPEVLREAEHILVAMPSTVLRSM